MTNKSIFCLCLVIVGYVSAVNCDEVLHVFADGAQLVSAGANNYGLTSPNLLSNGWKTLSINGNDAIIYSTNCQTSNRNLASFNQQEANQIRMAKGQLEALETNQMNMQMNIQKYSISRQNMFSTSGSRNTMSRNINTSRFENNGLSAIRYGDNDFSISKPNMANNLARVIQMGDVVTFIYLDNRVSMKPLSCLTPVEQQLIQQLRSEVQAAQRQFELSMQNMQQNLNHNLHNMHQNLNHNMQNMQQNLQQNMQSMQHNMQNMFSQGFPFNAGNQFMQQQVIPGYGSQAMYGNGYNGIGGASAYSGTYPPNFAPNQVPMFGTSWPFGPRNNPFGPGFPFNG